MQPTGATRGRRTAPIAAAVLAGTLIGPGIGALLLPGGAPTTAAAALVLVVATLVGVRGGVRAAVRWRRARTVERAGEGPRAVDGAAAAFAQPAQRAAAALAVLLLVLGALTAIGWAAATARPPTGPVDGADDVLVPALGALALSACIVPVLLAQAAWTRRPGPAEAEAAVLAGRVPGRRRLILACRGAAAAAWGLAALTGAVASGLAVQAGVQQAVAVVTAYSPREASASTRTELSGDGYLVADVRCPATAPLLHEALLRCTLTTLGAPASVRIRWTPSLTGVGSTQVTGEGLDRLATTADLTEPAPALSPPSRELSRRSVEHSVRAAMAAAGFDLRDPALAPVSCPGIGRGYDGFVRCDVGSGYGARSLDVYPDGDAVRPRLEELADLRR